MPLVVSVMLGVWFPRPDAESSRKADSVFCCQNKLLCNKGFEIFVTLEKIAGLTGRFKYGHINIVHKRILMYEESQN